jgi:hypothetical protein
MNSYEHLNFLFWPENSLFDEPNSGWPMVTVAFWYKTLERLGQIPDQSAVAVAAAQNRPLELKTAAYQQSPCLNFIGLKGRT